MNEIAFGTWKLPLEETPSVIQTAIASGYRHIDTAAAYANEAAIGSGIQQSSIDRAYLYISGKLWNSRRAYDAALKACRQSMANIGITYFDQYLMHWPFSPLVFDNWAERNSETWLALEALHAAGSARHIGVCNFTPMQLSALMRRATIMPEVNQIEFHPGFNQEETLAFCKENHIRVEAWSPLGNGDLMQHPLLTQIGSRHQCSVAQVCIAWCMAHEVKPITKTIHPNRMQENLAWDKVQLTDEEMFAIDHMQPCAHSGLELAVQTR